MISELANYYFPAKYTITKRFVQRCYSCFLSHGSSRKNEVGIYPTPNFPFEEIVVDLAENLNTVNGFSHLLITECALTDFVIIIPLKSKSAAEVGRALTYSVLQPFNVKRIHQDNAQCFRSSSWLRLMSALGITIVATSALHPAGRGQVERLVGTVKLTMKKMLGLTHLFKKRKVLVLVLHSLGYITVRISAPRISKIFGESFTETPHSLATCIH